MKSRNPSLLSNSAPPRLADALPNRPNRMSSFSQSGSYQRLARYNRPSFNPINFRGRPMKIAVIHDYADVFRTTRAYKRLQGPDVVAPPDAYTDPARGVRQVAGYEARLPTQRRVAGARASVAPPPALGSGTLCRHSGYHGPLRSC